jgi:TRAP-type mannitol/chloroaromatic compound transport system permease small subunit
MMRRFCDIVDGVNEKVGKYACWLVLPMMAAIFYEVVMRYLFNMPTIWVWDSVRIMLLPYVILTAGYGLVQDVYIRVDFFFAKLSPKAQAWVDLFLTNSMFFFFVSVLLWQGGYEVVKSWGSHERMTSLWAPRLYPVKTVALIGVFLMWLQGIAAAIRNVIEIKTGVFRKRVSGFIEEEEK